MGNTNKNTTGTDFTMVPHVWSCRKDVSLAIKVIVGYIYTRANITEIEWELVAADIIKIWRLPKATVSKVMKELEGQRIIRFSHWEDKNGDFPSKIYRINRFELKKLMTPPTDAVPPGNRHGSPCEPPQFIRRTSTVPPVNLEEENKNKIEKKSLKEEAKPAQSPENPFFNKISVLEPRLPKIAEELLSKCSSEQLAWLDDSEANKTIEKDLRAGKDVRWTKKFNDCFANM